MIWNIHRTPSGFFFFWRVCWSIWKRSRTQGDLRGQEILVSSLNRWLPYTVRSLNLNDADPSSFIFFNVLIRRPWILIVLLSVTYRNSCHIFWVVCCVWKNRLSHDYISCISDTTTYRFQYLDQVVHQDYSLELLCHPQGPVYDVLGFGNNIHVFFFIESRFRMTCTETSSSKVILRTAVVSDPLVPSVW